MGVRWMAPATDSLHSLLETDHAAEAGSLMGLEHEYRLSRLGAPVDFSAMIHGLTVPGTRLDPGDCNAYRCQSGLALTCDDAEAEVASPPVGVGPGFTGLVDDWARMGRELLDRILPSGIDVDGFSTHLSAAMPDRHADRVVDLLVRTFAPSLMMVLDRPDSHGIFLRPRPSRMELCGEFATGNRLRAAAALFAGAARACADVARGPVPNGAALPPALAIQTRVAAGRYGVEVDRHLAFGFDLYDGARSAVLTRQNGDTIPAQVHLELAWRCARAALAPVAAPADLDPMDRIVGGAFPLGVESTFEEAPGGGGAAMAPTPYGRLLAGRQRPGFDLAPVVATWSFTVFGLRAEGGQRFVCIPRSGLPQFLDLLDMGVLDDVLAAAARAPSAGRVLAAFAQTQHAELWDAVGDRTELLPPERDPVPPSERRRTVVRRHPPAHPSLAARPGKPSTFTTITAPAGSRPGKPAVALTAPASIPPGRPVRVAAAPPPVPARRRRPRPAAVMIGVLVLATLAGAALVAGVLSGKADRRVASVATTAVTSAPLTSMVPTTAGPTTTADPTSTTSPAPVTTTVPSPTTLTTVPATASTMPAATTAPTVPGTTTVPPTTTTIPAPTTLAVNNCAFSPATSTTPRGTTIRFRNDSPTATITLTLVGPPGSGDVFFSVEPGGVSGPYVPNVAGTYVFLCRGAGTGQIVVTAT